MATAVQPGAAGLSPIPLHPYLRNCTDLYQRLVRAHFWFVVDMHPGHADYWRDQISRCERDFLLSSVGGDRVPADVRVRRQAVAQGLVGNALREAYAASQGRFCRGGTDVPTFRDVGCRGGFSSCSASTTATNSTRVEKTDDF